MKNLPNKIAFQPLDIACDQYFPTMIFSWDCPNAAVLNGPLRKAIYAERTADEKGLSRSDRREFDGWHSKNDLHLKPAFAGLVRQARTMGAHILSILAFDLAYMHKISTVQLIASSRGDSGQQALECEVS